jgi:hypothetical protein
MIADRHPNRGADVIAIAALLSDELGYPAHQLNLSDLHPNTHFRAGPYFVKVMAGKKAYYDAERAAAEALSTRVAAPRLICTGETPDGARWLAFDWHDFAEVVPDATGFREAGVLAGALHATSRRVPGLRARSIEGLPEATIALIDRIEEFDESLAERLRQLQAEISPVELPHREHTGLLHGDFGWRNLRRGPDRRLWLMDFEHARWGHPYLEFAKAWDRELADPDSRRWFLEGYDTTAPLPSPGPADLAEIRLWAAAGIFPYAREHGDRQFAEQGNLIVERLETELRDSRA